MSESPLSIYENESMSAADMRGKIMDLESSILAQPDKIIEFALEHYFAPGLYLRQMTMPKNSLLTGKIHKTEHICILAKGSVSVASESGTKVLSAPAVLHASPGTKRAIFAHEESVWINVHHNPTNEKDLEKVEDIFVTDDYEKYLNFVNQAKSLGGE